MSDARRRKFCLLIKCACGCGEYLRESPNDRHRNRKRLNFEHRYRLRNYNGENHPRWKGGIKKGNDGYVYVYMPDHHRAYHDRYVAQHTLVFEEFYHCCLVDWGLVHHINEVKDDNRIENLKGMTKSQHQQLHIRDRRDPITGKFL